MRLHNEILDSYIILILPMKNSLLLHSLHTYAAAWTRNRFFDGA